MAKKNGKQSNPAKKAYHAREFWRAKYDDPEWAKEHGLDKHKGSANVNAFIAQYDSWLNWGEGIDDDGAADPPVVFDRLQETTEFFERNGDAPKPGMYVDRDANPSCPDNEADAIRILFELLEQVEEHTERVWQKKQDGTLRPDSYAYSVDMLLDTVISKCGMGRPGLALEDIFHLGRLYAYLQLEDREGDAERGVNAKKYPSMGGNAKKTKPDIAKKVIQKVLDLQAASNKSDSAIYEEVGEDPDLPHKSTVRRIMLEYASKKIVLQC